jgi:hypothetical protein
MRKTGDSWNQNTRVFGLQLPEKPKAFLPIKTALYQCLSIETHFDVTKPNSQHLEPKETINQSVSNRSRKIKICCWLFKIRRIIIWENTKKILLCFSCLDGT